MPPNKEAVPANISKKAQKILLGAISVVGILLCTSVLCLTLYVPFFIKKQLEKEVGSSSAQQWQLSVGAVNIYWLRFSFALEQLELRQSGDSASIQDSIAPWHIRVGRLECSGIELLKFLQEDTLRISAVNIYKAEVKGGFKVSERSEKMEEQPWQPRLQAAIKKITPQLYIGELSLENTATALHITTPRGKQKHAFLYFYARLAPLVLGEAFAFDSLQVHLAQYEGRSASGAVWGLQEVSFRSSDSTIEAGKLRWEQSPVQKISLEKLYIEHWAWQTFLQSQEVHLGALRLYRPDVWWTLSEKHFSEKEAGFLERLLQEEAPPEMLLRCDYIEVEEASGHLWQPAPKALAQHDLSFLSFQARGLQLNSGAPQPTDRLQLEALKLSAAGYHYADSAQVQALGLDSLHYNSEESLCALLGFAWQQKGLQAAFETLLMQKIDLAALWYQQGLSLGYWQLQAPSISLQLPLQRNEAQQAPASSDISWLRYYELAGLEVSDAQLFLQKNTEALTLRDASFSLDRLREQAPFRSQALPEQIALRLQETHIASGQYQQKTTDTDLGFQGLHFVSKQGLQVEALHWQQAQQAILAEGLALQGLDWAAYWQQKKFFAQKIASQSLQISIALPDAPAPLADTLAGEEAALLQDSLVVSGPVRRFEEALEGLLKRFAKEIQIDTLHLQGLKAALQGGAEKPSHEIKQGEIFVSAIRLGAVSAAEDSLPLKRFLMGKAYLHLQDYEMTAPDSQMRIQIKDFLLDKETAACTLSGLQYQDEQGNMAKIPQFYIKKIDWDYYWQHEYLQIGLLALPEAQIHLLAKTTAKAEPSQNPLLPPHFREQLAQKAQEVVAQIGTGLAIDSLLLKKINISLEIKEANLWKNRHQIDSIGLLMTDFRIDSNTRVGAPERFLFAEQLQIAARKYSFRTAQKAFLIENEYLHWHSRDSSLRAEGLHLRNGEELTLKAPQMQIVHISLRDYLSEQDLRIAEMIFEKPSLRYFRDKTRIPIDAKPRRNVFEEDSVSLWQKQLQALIPLAARSIHLHRLSLQEGSFQYAQRGYKGLLRQSLEYINVEVMDAHLDSSSLQTPKTLFIADRANLDFRNYTLVQPDSMYQLRIAAGSIDTKSRQATLSAIHYRPLLSEEQVIRLKPTYKSRLNAHAESIQLQQIDFAMLLKRNRLVIQKVQIEKVLLSVADDDRIAGNPKSERAMPNDLFRGLPFYLRMDTVAVEDSRIIYKENILGGRGEGEITFEDFEARAYELSNDSLIPYSNLLAKAKFMNEGLLLLKLRIPLMKEDFQMDFEGSLGAMDAILINRMIESNAHVNLKRGQVKRISFEGNLSNYVAQGKMLAVYKGFKVRVLKRDSYKKRGLISFLANLLLNQTNKRKQGNIEYYRLGTDGFMKLIWKSIGSGLKDTLLPAIVKRRL